MKLKPVKKAFKPVLDMTEIKGLVVLENPTTKEKPSKKSSGVKSEMSKKYSDTYTPLLDPIRFLVRSYPSYKNPKSIVKDYIEISIKRWDEGDENPILCFLNMYRESEAYTGYLKGKSIHFPIEMLGEVVDNLQNTEEECYNNNLSNDD